jgi:hypothetical protein
VGLPGEQDEVKPTCSPVAGIDTPCRISFDTAAASGLDLATSAGRGDSIGEFDGIPSASGWE